jgi:DNA-binding NarL/FixJ family response regulator
VKTSFKTFQVVLADDHPVVLGGLRDLVRTDPMFEIVAECLDGATALQTIEDQKPELAILDIAMPGLSGVDVLTAIGERRLSTRIIILTATADDSQIVEAVSLGAYGLMLKDAAADTLLACMRAVSMGNRWLPAAIVEPATARELKRRGTIEHSNHPLTPREREIVRLVAEGRSNKEIGLQIGVTEGTVKMHLHNIYQKLGINNRTALAALVLGHRTDQKP